MSIGKIIGLGTFGIIFLVAFSAFFGAFYTIDAGYRGVILRNGAITGIAEPGLGWKMPFITSVAEISTQQQARLYENVAAYSKDQQTAMLRVSVTYSIPPDKVTDMYSQYSGSFDNLLSRVLDRQVNEQVEIVFGQFNAITAVQDRGRLSSEISSAIKKVVYGPIAIHAIQVENIDFSDAYETSIEERMKAEVEVQRLKQNAEREKVQAQIVVTQAQAQADSVLAKAQSEAKAITMRGDAEANAINAKGKALRDNPALVGLIQAERWDGKLPTTMVPGGTVPFLNVDKMVNQ